MHTDARANPKHQLLEYSLTRSIFIQYSGINVYGILMDFYEPFCRVFELVKSELDKEAYIRKRILPLYNVEGVTTKVEFESDPPEQI